MTFALNTLQEFQFTDARSVGSPSNVLSHNYKDEAGLDSQLATAMAAYYTPAVLAGMTINDKIFAVRSLVDSAGFMPNGTTSGMG